MIASIGIQFEKKCSYSRSIASIRDEAMRPRLSTGGWKALWFGGLAHLIADRRNAPHQPAGHALRRQVATSVLDALDMPVRVLSRSRYVAGIFPAGGADDGLSLE
jgi:hypothetical protein